MNITSEYEAHTVPIDIDRFESAERLHDPPTGAEILRFLLEHEDRAYTRREIATAIDADPETVGTNLTRLKDRGLVRHREPYWALTDDRERASEYLRTQYGEVPTEETEHAGETIDATSEGDETPNPSWIETAGRPHREAAESFAERVRDRLGDVIDSCYLFGSVARDDASAGSDVDVLVVVADDAEYAAVDDQLLDIAYDIQLESGVRIEIHSMRAGEFAAREEREDPLVRSVIEDGEAIV